MAFYVMKTTSADWNNYLIFSIKRSYGVFPNYDWQKA